MMTFFHVVFGSVALAAAPAALLLRKGGFWHRRCGALFALAMSVVLFSAAFMWQKKGHLFLVPLAVVSAYLIFTGYRSLLRHKRRRSAPPQTCIDIGADCMAVAAGLGVVYLGVSASTPLMHSIEPALLGVGSIAVAYALNDMLGFTAPRMKVGWLLGHFSAMIAAYISAVTAFVVINAHAVPIMLCWIVPSSVGASVIVAYTLRFVRFGIPRWGRSRSAPATGSGFDGRDARPSVASVTPPGFPST